MANSTYLDAITRNKLLQHVAAISSIRKDLCYFEEQLIRVSYKPRLTNRDLGKIYSALNCLASLSNDAEASACRSLLRKLGLKVNHD